MFFYKKIRFSIIVDKTFNKSPSKIMFKATVPAATVRDGVSNCFGQVINRLGEIVEFDHNK